MAQIISTSVYDFGSVGNQMVSINVMGLPVQGAFVSKVGGTAPYVPYDGKNYVYSKISYPSLGAADKEFLTAETVAQILTKMNA